MKTKVLKKFKMFNMLKKLIIIILIVAVILSVSYLYPTSNMDTEIACYGLSTSSNRENITIYLIHNEGSIINPDIIKSAPVGDMPIFVNITDENNRIKSYNLTTNAKGQARVNSLEKRNYNVSVIFEGKYGYNPSRWEGKLNLQN